MTQDDLPFEGVKVLDLSQGVAGPYCGMHLARNGANVIKVEPTGVGCWSRRLGKHTGDHTAHSVIVNRAKRSLSIDLKSEQGVAIVLRLAKECDVLIHNYRVGKIDKFKLDYESVKKTNPNIVYAHITGFGATGPARRQSGHGLGDAGLYGDDVDQPRYLGCAAAHRNAGDRFLHWSVCLPGRRGGAVS